MRYKVYNTMWCYEIITDSNNTIISTNSYPNNKEHWVVGLTLDQLKLYHKRDVTIETDIDKLTHVYIEEIKILK